METKLEIDFRNLGRMVTVYKLILHNKTEFYEHKKQKIDPAHYKLYRYHNIKINLHNSDYAF